MNLTLVTGASGFVGSYLLKELQRQSIPATGVSRTAKNDLLQIPTYGQEMNWGPILEGVDTIIHLAARVHVMKDRASDPLSEFRKANVDATLHLANAAVKAGARRFIFVSTIKVNGETTQPGRPFTADDTPNPQGPYAASKAEAEAALMEIGRTTGLEIVIIRPPLVYGPGAKGNLEKLNRLSRLRLPAPFGTVKNKRSLVHISNLCSAIITAIHKQQAANQIFLVADSTCVSTNDLMLDLGWVKAPKALDILFAWTVPTLLALNKTAKDRLLSNLELDVEKTRTLLNWTPSPFRPHCSNFRSEGCSDL